ncbi:hypothetical protein HK101_000645 [Irineochytrium annulatum]|nr:hypothetical protein HK101_000645 [Irineochytrium annulatum]
MPTRAYDFTDDTVNRRSTVTSRAHSEAMGPNTSPRRAHTVAGPQNIPGRPEDPSLAASRRLARNGIWYKMRKPQRPPSTTPSSNPNPLVGGFVDLMDVITRIKEGKMPSNEELDKSMQALLSIQVAPGLSAEGKVAVDASKHLIQTFRDLLREKNGDGAFQRFMEYAAKADTDRIKGAVGSLNEKTQGGNSHVVTILQGLMRSPELQLILRNVTELLWDVSKEGMPEEVQARVANTARKMEKIASGEINENQQGAGQLKQLVEPFKAIASGIVASESRHGHLQQNGQQQLENGQTQQQQINQQPQQQTGQVGNQQTGVQTGGQAFQQQVGNSQAPNRQLQYEQEASSTLDQQQPQTVGQQQQQDDQGGNLQARNRQLQYEQELAQQQQQPQQQQQHVNFATANPVGFTPSYNSSTLQNVQRASPGENVDNYDPAGIPGVPGPKTRNLLNTGLPHHGSSANADGTGQGSDWEEEVRGRLAEINGAGPRQQTGGAQQMPGQQQQGSNLPNPSGNLSGNQSRNVSGTSAANPPALSKALVGPLPHDDQTDGGNINSSQRNNQSGRYQQNNQDVRFQNNQGRRQNSTSAAQTDDDIDLVPAVSKTLQLVNASLTEQDQPLLETIQGDSGKPEKEHLDTTADRLVHMLRRLHSSPSGASTRRSMLGLVDMMDELRPEWEGISETKEDYNMQLAFRELKTILERFSVNHDLDIPIASYKRFMSSLTQRANFRILVDDFFTTIRRALQDRRYAEDPDMTERIKGLILRLNEEIRGEDDGVRQKFHETMNSWKEFVAGIGEDGTLQKVTDAVTNLTSALVVDRNGQPTFKQALLTDVIHVIIPSIWKSMEVIPIPRVEHLTHEMDVVVEDIMLRTAEICPDAIEVAVMNAALVGLQNKMEGVEFSNTATITLHRIRANLRDMPFYYSKKKGFPTRQDQGVANVFIGGNGITVTVQLALNLESPDSTLNPQKVLVDIDDLQLDIFGTRNDSYYKLFKSAINTKLKSELSDALGLRIVRTVSDLDEKLTEMKLRWFEESDADTDDGYYSSSVVGLDGKKKNGTWSKLSKMMKEGSMVGNIVGALEGVMAA